MKRPLIIAIDGYSSCGKSTLARALAGKLHYVFVDSGAMYRAFTLFCIRLGAVRNGVVNEKAVVDLLDKARLSFRIHPETRASQVYLNDENVEGLIRSLEVSDSVSPISALKPVREKVLLLQRAMAGKTGLVMDGRDIGTNVFPNADLKIFMTADPEVRVKRRFDELKTKGELVEMNQVRENLIARDLEDTTRKHNPLVQAKDAVVLDNSHMTQQQQLDWALEKVAELTGEA